MNDRAVAANGYHWTTLEKAVIAQHYPEAGVARCVEMLPHRGIGACYAMARRLGLSAPPAANRLAGRRFAKKYPADDRIDLLIRDAYAAGIVRGKLKALALDVGRPRWWVQKRAVDLGCTIERVAPLPWCRTELALLEQHAACLPKIIARKLADHGFRRSPTAVVQQLKRRGIDRSDPDSWSATDLAQLVGVNPKTVADWIDRRGLKAQKVSDAQRSRFVITRRALRAWLRDHHGFVDLRRVDQPWLWGLMLGGDEC